MLISICKVVCLTDQDWVSLTKYDPKKMRNKKLLNKKHETERAYDKLSDAVNTLLEEPVEVPEIKPINQASTKKIAQDTSHSTDGVWMGVQLTATAVHPDTTMLTQVLSAAYRYGVVRAPRDELPTDAHQWRRYAMATNAYNRRRYATRPSCDWKTSRRSKRKLNCS